MLAGLSAVFGRILLLTVIKRTQFVFSCLPEVKLLKNNHLDSSVQNEVICNKFEQFYLFV